MLKTAWAVILALALLPPRTAQADTLVTGAIRDQAGSAIAGASVTALDARGRPVGTDVALADGTFAVTARTAPATIAITCAYCRAVRLRVDPGEPVVAIVDRFTAVTASGPSAADVRALPYRSAADIASLRPFAVVADGRITDRGLDGDAAVLIDGLPFYRAADGADLSALVPAHAVAAIGTASPLSAPRYGGYADAGIDDVRLSDPDYATSRIDSGDASDLVARVQTANAGGGYAASSDPGDDRQSANADANLPFAGGRLSLTSLALSDAAFNAAGTGLAYTTDSRRFTTSGSLSATQSDAASLIAGNAEVRNHGPLGLTFGVRAMRATSSYQGAGAVQFDSAIYAAAKRDTRLSQVSATVAVESGGDAGLAGGSRTAALVGSLADDLRLGAYWSLHAGAVSNLRIPTFAEVTAAAPVVIGGDRSLLFEQALSYTDLRRVRLSGSIYTERATGSATRHVNGAGIDAAWQIAPQLSVRAWVLRANQSALPAYDAGEPYEYDAAPTAAPLTRQLIWLSYEKYVRVDALMRGGALEGDLRIPLDTIYAFTIGSARYNGRRVTTFGVTRR